MSLEAFFETDNSYNHKSNFKSEKSIYLENGWIHPLIEYFYFYDGVSRGKLKEIDERLYRRLYRLNLTKYVPKRKLEDPQKEYETKYNGVSRGKLLILDRALYGRLRKSGKLAIVPRIIKEPKRI